MPRSRSPRKRRPAISPRPQRRAAPSRAAPKAAASTREHPITIASFPRKRESRATALPLLLDPRFCGGDGESLTSRPNADLADYLLSAAAVRERCAIVLA